MFLTFKLIGSVLSGKFSYLPNKALSIRGQGNESRSMWERLWSNPKNFRCPNESEGEGEKMKKINVDVKIIYGETAKLADLPQYEAKAVELAGQGNDVVLTGAGPVWLYLRLAHSLHGKCRSLAYSSPVTGEVIIFDHNPR